MQKEGSRSSARSHRYDGALVSAPVLVALDLPTAEEAVRLARDVKEHVAGFKVGLGLLHGPGPGTVTALADL